MIKRCKICDGLFKSFKSANRKYCSLKCMGLSKIGDKNPAKKLEVRKKISKNLTGKNLGNTHGFQKGHIPSFLCIEQGRKNLLFLNKFVNNQKNIIKKRVENVVKKGIFKRKNNPNWKGGITDKNILIRNSKQIKEWRKEVFKRDNFICQITGQKGMQLVAHHINSFNNNPTLRLEIDNGITLSKSVHNLFHKIYGKGNNTYQQLECFRGIING